MTEAPAQPPATPSDGTDDLGMAVLQGLSRPIARKQTPRLLLTCVVGILSFGVLPVLRWAKRFGQFVALEQQQLWHLAEWLRLNAGSAEAAELRDQANRIRTRPILTLGSVLLALAAVAMELQQLRMTSFSWHALVAFTYRFTDHRWHWAMRAYLVWGGGLAVAYGLHWLQVGLHAMDRQRFMRALERITAGEGSAPLQPTPLGVGARPLWVVAGVVMTVCGAPWGVPMMLAGAIQRSEITQASLRDRQAMARRLHAMLRKRWASEVAMPVYLRRLCSDEFCRATLPEGANFCPRCGRRAREAMHRVA